MLRTLLFCAACAATPSLVAADQWFGQDGQGFRSAAIQHDGVYLGVNCATPGANLISTVTLAHGGQKPTGTISFTFDYDDSSIVELSFVAGTFQADSATNQQLFAQLIQGLKAGRWVEVLNPPSEKPLVPLKGSGSALAGC